MSNTGVIIAEKRKASEQSYLQSFGTYVSGFSSYIPSGLKKQLVTAQNHEEKDKVTWVAFDTYERDGKSRQCLVLAFVNGFQVWDIEDPDNTFELLSKREGAIKLLKFVQTPFHPAKKGRLSDKHPVLALASADESQKFPKNAVKLYSLREQEYINTMRFRSEIYSILCSKRMLVVALCDHIYGFDVVNMEKIFSKPYYPQDPLLREIRSYGKSPASPSQGPQKQNTTNYTRTIALGSRWLAYPAKKVQGQKDEEPEGGALNLNQIVDVAKYLGDVGRKTVTSYIYPESHTPTHSPPIEDHSNYGNVIVYDVCSGKTIAHFRAHKEPLALLAFDPSGTLLITVPASGQEFNVFQIAPNNGHIHEAVHHIYTLVRGLTSAMITDVAFSNDSRWLAVSSAHGTTHIYAITPEGGAVNIHTHIPSEPIASYEAPFLMHYTQPRNLTLNVVNRIKQTTATTEESKTLQAMTVASFANSPNSGLNVYVVAQTGIMTQYNLQPHPPLQPGPDVDPKALQVSVDPAFYWDLCRRSSWGQHLIRLKPKKAEEGNLEVLHHHHNGKHVEPSWLANVEICTHTNQLRPLWAGPQFTFKTFLKPEGQEQGFPENKVEVRYKPMPINVSGDIGSSWGGSINDLEITIPSAPVEREEIVKADITKAMSTQIEFGGDRAHHADSFLISDSMLGEYRGKNVASSSSASRHSSLQTQKKNRQQGDTGRRGEPHADGPPIHFGSSPVFLSSSYNEDDDPYADIDPRGRVDGDDDDDDDESDL